MKHYYSIDEENFNLECVEDAAESAWELGDSNVGDVVTVWDGEVVECVASQFIPNMADDMAERANDVVGDSSYLWEFTKELEQSLQDAVRKAVDDWANKNDMQPKFCEIGKVTPIQIRFTDEDGGFEIVGGQKEETK